MPSPAYLWLLKGIWAMSLWLSVFHICIPNSSWTNLLKIKQEWCCSIACEGDLQDNIIRYQRLIGTSDLAAFYCIWTIAWANSFSGGWVRVSWTIPPGTTYQWVSWSGSRALLFPELHSFLWVRMFLLSKWDSNPQSSPCPISSVFNTWHLSDTSAIINVPRGLCWFSIIT